MPGCLKGIRALFFKESSFFFDFYFKTIIFFIIKK